MGHGAWGMGHGKDSQCPMPNAQSRRAVVTELAEVLSLSTHKGMEFPADFQ